MTNPVLEPVRAGSGGDRRLWWLIGAAMVIGAAGNYVRVHVPGHWSAFPLFCMFVLTGACIAAVLIHSVWTGNEDASGFGFSFRAGTLLSVAVITAVYAYRLASGQFDKPAPAALSWTMLAAFFEEIVFRGALIPLCVRALSRTRYPILWSVLLSSILFAIPHLASKSPADTFGVFTGGLLLGAIFCVSKSLVGPAWMHVLANAGFTAAAVAVFLYCLLTGAGVLIRRKDAR